MTACRTCRHWDPDTNGHDPGFGRCRAIPDGSDDMNPKSFAERDPAGYAKLAHTTDAEGYYSALYTRPDFSCILWSECEGVETREGESTGEQ